MLLNLPPELLLRILALLPVNDLGRVAQVCHALRAHSEDNQIWNPLLKSQYRLEEAGQAKFRFLTEPNMRLPKYLLVDPLGRKFAFNQVLQNRHDDPISRIMRVVGEVYDEEHQRFKKLLAYDSPDRISAIMRGEISTEDAIALEIVDSGYEQIMSRDYFAFPMLTSGVRAYIATEQLSLEEALAVSREARFNLDSSVIRAYIAIGKLTVTQALHLSPQANLNLGCSHVQAYIATGQLSIEAATQMTNQGIRNLYSVEIRAFIASGYLTAKAATELSKPAYDVLCTTSVQEDILSGKLPIQHAIQNAEQPLLEEGDAFVAPPPVAREMPNLRSHPI